MKDGAEDFVVESTPVLDLKKHGLIAPPTVSSVNEENWDSDRTEVYADVDGENAIASLIGEHGENYPITTFPFVMGRGSECDLVLQGKGVSRRHAEVIFQSGRFVVNDLESLNGLKVNGYKVARVILEENDVIKLGDVALVFRSSGSVSAGRERESGAKGKKGLFATKDVEASTKFDGGIYRANPLRKLIIGSVVLATVGVVAFAGYRFFLQQVQPAGRIIEKAGVAVGGETAPNDPPKSQTVTVPPPIAVAKPVASEAPGAANSVVDDGIAPPPSIAPSSSTSMQPSLAEVSAPSNQADASAVSVRADADVSSQAPSKSSVSKVVASKPVVAVKAPVKAVPQADATEKARSALADADRLYFQGQADDALIALKPVITDARVSEAVRQQVKTAHNNYSALYNQYMSGQAAFSRGDKESAFQQWTAFMDKESSLFEGRKSSYTRSISSRVVDEYVSLGNEASRKGDHHAAYRNWQKALDLGDSVAAKIAIDNANNRAMQLYRQALRLEYVNTSKARSLWQEVTELLPPGTEYNTKASAKLAWYDKWGS